MVRDRWELDIDTESEVLGANRSGYAVRRAEPLLRLERLRFVGSAGTKSWYVALLLTINKLRSERGMC